MKKRLSILIVAFLLVPVVLYMAVPELLVDLFADLARKSAGLSRGSVVVGDHTIVYLEGGQGETLLLHGLIPLFCARNFVEEETRDKINKPSGDILQEELE